MRILQVHNRYQVKGGESSVMEVERELLTAAGHHVQQWIVSNQTIHTMGPLQRLRVALGSVWSPRSKAAMHEHLAEFEPDVVHVHNFQPLLSPSIFAACRAFGVPAVQTLHNYRMVCPGSLLQRDGRVCHDCVGRRVAWPGVVHGCYRGSRLQTAATAGMVLGGHLRGTWRRDVARFIVNTDFAREVMIDGGIERERLFVKPNSVSDPGPPVAPAAKPYFLCASRLVQEKGIETLLRAWAAAPDLPRLKLAGDGPLLERARAAAAADSRIEVLGMVPREGMDHLIRGALATLVPSLWYEGFPMTIVESLARGVPVVVSDLGGLPTIVRDGRDGVCVPAGDPDALAAACARVCRPACRQAWAEGAREAYLTRFQPEVNYELLMTCYAETGACAPLSHRNHPDRRYPTPIPAHDQCPEELPNSTR